MTERNYLSCGVAKGLAGNRRFGRARIRFGESFGLRYIRRVWTNASTILLLVASMLIFAGRLHATDTVTYYYTDTQGTVLATADAGGHLVSSSEFRPYGARVIGSSEQALAYTGHMDDSDTGLVYMQARYYEPSVGRFLSADPIPPSSGLIEGFSRYAYVSNNPLTLIDPTGMEEDCSAACRAMRRLSDSLSLNAAGGGAVSSRVLAQSGQAELKSQVRASASSLVADAAPLADVVPGATIAACAGVESCSGIEVAVGVMGFLPGDGEAVGFTVGEVVQINRTFGGVYARNSVEAMFANMSYREGAVAKAATAIRDIAGGHMFNNGNKRTAQAVAEKILEHRVDPSQIRTAVEAAKNGANHEEIMTRLGH